MQDTITPTPFRATGKILSSLLVMAILSIWLVGLSYYFALPDRVPIHFNISGKPDSYGSKEIFLVLSAIFSLAPLIILLTAIFRFTLINNFPYLINLPGFFANIGRIRDDRKGYWFNKYFEIALATGAAITVFLIVLLVEIGEGISNGHLPSWFTRTMMFLPFVLIAPFIYALFRLSRQMSTEASGT